MATFNYKNAYKLAVQTNKELHMALGSYKTMLEEAQKELKDCYAQIDKLRAELHEERIRAAGIDQ